MEPIIEVKNLVKTFNFRGKKITAVNNVSFNVLNLGKMVALDNPEVLKENSGSSNLEQVFMHFAGEEVCN